MICLPIEAPRLVLRPLDQSEGASVYRILAHQPTTANVSFGLSSLADAQGWLERRISDQNEFGFSMWGVELAGEVVGLCGFFATERTQEVELGYVIHADHWGCGLATEAAGAALTSMVATGRTVVATIRPSNAASLRVAEKIGLEMIGEEHNENGRLLVFRSRSLD